MKFRITNIFFVILPFIFGCGYRSRYGVGFDPIDTNTNSINRSFAQYKLPYSNLTGKDIIAKALENRFIHDKDNNPLDIEKNNNLEEGLGYIFMNCLRFKLKVLENECKDVSHYVEWKDKCPKPWKYRTQVISNKEYGVFYLESVQMGEYYPNDKDSIVRNYDIVKNEPKKNRKSPYITVYYTDEETDKENKKRFDVPVEIDHLLRDNSYLIELPACLHKIKSKYLDPFLLYPTQTDRKGLHHNYWNNRKEFLDFKKNYDNSSSEVRCICGNPFKKPNEDFLEEHNHEDTWGDKWNANMQKKHIFSCSI
ncbi:hypothetical protein [Cardinium endosymbiont of Encarsia pergandiella]|uniref:hypothetical protein n=1 Tax=Cardinium endosymbiont of Encarsia pergandiella TaxID=249402 RepID=UPI0005A2F322|nr:hypothetical protein [Cardinium endosymbiont of Encarsia pergandiella]